MLDRARLFCFRRFPMRPEHHFSDRDWFAGWSLLPQGDRDLESAPSGEETTWGRGVARGDASPLGRLPASGCFLADLAKGELSI